MSVTTWLSNGNGFALARRAAAVGLLAASALPGPAGAQPYTVVSCDAAVGLGYSAAAWRPSHTIGTAYASCPSRGGLNGGISNRVTNTTAPAFAYSAHTFNAPSGATITAIRWGGRFARGDCRWGALLQALPSRTVLIGLRPRVTCASTSFDIRGQSLPLAPPPGTTSLQQIVVCGASSCPEGATFHTQGPIVTINDPTRPTISVSGPLVSRRWVSGLQRLNVVARDNSGISGVWVSAGHMSKTMSYGCNYSNPRPCADRPDHLDLQTNGLPDGRNEVTVTAFDAARNSLLARYRIHVDNEPPARIQPSLDGATGWRRRNGFSVRWTNPAQAYAPIVRARYRLCGSHGCSDGYVDGPNIQTLGPIVLGEQGTHTLQVWLEDEAGNQSYALTASDPIHLLLDQEAPTVSFEGPDAGDPLRVSVRTFDLYSGLDSGEIEINRRGSKTWHSLATAREGNSLVAYVDDERFRSGVYEFRAHARDLAGNESSTDRRANGSRATIELPVRFVTRLAVGVPRVSHRHRKHARTRLIRAARVHYGQHLRIHGRLENSDGQPLDDATIEVSSDSPGDTVGLLPVGLARTDRKGRFTYVARATRNKVLRFRYEGSRRIRAATADFVLHVPAATTVRAHPARLRNGQTVHLSGRIRSRPLPAQGKLIEIQAFFRGRWRTFSTTRADHSGRWRFDYRFGGTRGRVRYRLRARLPAEGGYPFDTGHSPKLRVLVVGPSR